ncbi:antiviral innate immune response receptor RIG-I [Protopterus annectens]|uniref:antiviral innate immune response receptor RIG-I n=1 Tax=Protopterus annectens TaxID=7888 RepID=UPI001CFC2D42|nr:antiviral innate immune response receptor RIG-I [Protopterus annectens]
MTAEQKNNLRQFKQYITSSLYPSHVLDHMREWISREDVEQIKSEEKRGVTAGAEMFFECLLKLEGSAWFTGFLDGLHASGYTGLEVAIKDWDFSKIDSLEDNRKLLERIAPSLSQNIKPEEIALFLRKDNCLLNVQNEEICKITEQRGNTAGALYLLDCLLRSDKENWPTIFKMALEETNCPVDTIKLWSHEPENGKSSSEAPENEENECGSIEMCFQEDGESMDMSAADGAVSRLPDEPPGMDVEPPVLHLREYQKELAQPTFGGANTIICAPTGSGKTIVALEITERHLKQNSGSKKMVVFLTTKVPVCEQQYQLFKKHFEPSGYNVVGLYGETADATPRGKLIEKSDIVVLTAQILVNCLDDGSIPSLSVFTLLIFDECHNTARRHPYNVMMSRYLDIKLGRCASTLPQVVGLTASVGVGTAKNVTEAISYICHICANLDVTIISTVQKNVAELEHFIYRPKKYFEQVHKRVNDHFKDDISEIMAKVEGMARKIHPIDELSNIKNREHGTQKYEQWIVDVQKRCRTLQLKDRNEESRLCRSLFSLTEVLRKYNDALIINEDARTKDAVAYLEKFFNDIKNAGFDALEQQLTKMFEDKKQKLNKCVQEEAEQNENPKLESLTFILTEEYRINPQTRTLLFVKTRALANALKTWIEETEVLHFLKPDILIGRGKRDQKTGMTLPSQESVLKTFKEKDDINILIATSVADEGIDIASCNLVLLYEYVGNVIKMIQVRGRGRAQGSKCYLITSKVELIEKERINLLHEELMNEAIQKLQEMDQKKFLQMIHEDQQKEKAARDFEQVKPQKQLQQGSRILRCGKCKVFACNIDDIRVIKGSHHVVKDETFPERYETKPHGKPVSYDGFCKKSKLFCKQCMHDWGIIASYATLDNLPVIKIESFVVENSSNKEQRCFRKWRDVDFAMKEFSVVEMSKNNEDHTGADGMI